MIRYTLAKKVFIICLVLAFVLQFAGCKGNNPLLILQLMTREKIHPLQKKVPELLIDFITTYYCFHKNPCADRCPTHTG